MSRSVVVLTAEICRPTVFRQSELLEIVYLKDFEQVLRVHLLDDLFEITHFLDYPPNTLSLGERMRCEIVADLIHRPSILYHSQKINS